MESVPVHDWQKQELARRKANLLKNPESAVSWEDVMQRTRAVMKQGTSSLRDLKPEAFPDGNERLSLEIDTVVYHGKP